MVNPITPNQAAAQAGRSFPPEVVAAFNELIARNYRGGESVVKREEVIDEIVNSSEFNEKQIFANHWLDVELIYMAAGWDVVYDKPGFNETPYDPHFVFGEKK
jgi:hypothetical protein